MASSTTMALLLSLSLILPSSLATVVCEKLPKDLCAFAVSSSSKRCLLESYQQQHSNGKTTEYQCRTSEVVVEHLADWVETDQCVKECGIDRGMVGISSDSLLEPHFASKLCLPACFNNCPNVIDLYFNLAAGEGVFLPDLCEAQRVNPHRSMIDLLSSGVASGPAADQVEFNKQQLEYSSPPAEAPVASAPAFF